MNLSSIQRLYGAVYRQSNKWVMPVVGWVVFLYLNYLVMPQEYVSTTLNSATVLFLIGAWLSQTFAASIDPVLDQLIITRLATKDHYWQQKLWFMGLLNGGIAAISTALPVFINLIQHHGLFRRGLSVEEVVCSFLIHLVFSVTGGMVGLVIQPRYIFRDAKLSHLALILVAVISLVGSTMGEKIPGFSVVNWLFPPLSPFIALYVERYTFELARVLKELSWPLVYLILLIILYRYVQRKKLYA